MTYTNREHITMRLFTFCGFVGLLFVAAVARTGTGAPIISENFDANDGGFTVTSSPLPPLESEWTYSAANGSWSVDGSGGGGFANRDSALVSPSVNVAANGPVTLSFDHRYSFEGGLWDGGQVQMNVNGGGFVAVPDAAFSANGYTGFGLIGAHVLNGEDGFNGDSPGYGTPAFITSDADLGVFSAGDTIQLQFLGAWDQFAKGTEPNWEIDSVLVSDAAAAAVPEPTSVAIWSLLGLGLAGFGYYRVRRKK